MMVKVGDAIIKHRGVFVAELKFMHGDGDKYENVEIVLGDEGGVATLYEFLRGYSALSWNTRCCNHGAVRALDGYWSIFSNADSKEELLSNSFPGEEYWPRDVTSFDGYAMLTMEAVYYYDENGVAHYTHVYTEDNNA